MMHLVKSELKKIWKSKINLVLLICLFVFSAYRIYSVYMESHVTGQAFDYTLEDREGNEINGNVEYYRFADELHHRYAGKLDENTLAQMKQDNQAIQNSFVRTTPDDSYLRYIYGEDYASFLEKASKGVYSFNELQDAIAGMHVNGYSMDEKENSINAYFDYFYKEDRVLALYSLAYDGYYLFASTRDINALPDNFEPVSAVSKRVNQQTFIQKGDPLDADDLQYYNQRYQSLGDQYDSVIGGTLFVDALNSLEFMSILVLILLFSNTFAMEKHHKTDQIMVPTDMGWRRITMAKLGSAMMVGIGIVILQIMMALIMSYCILPMNRWDLPYFEQAGINLLNVTSFLFTYKELIWSAFLLMSLAALAASLITCCMSYLTKNNVLCVVPLLVFALITGSLDLFSILFPNSFVDFFLPSQMVHFTRYFATFASSTNVLQIGSQMVMLKDIVITFWICMIPCLLFIMFLVSKRFVLKTKRIA